MSIPPWGTPPSGLAASRPETTGAPAAEPAAGLFVVLIEQLTGSGDSAVWRLDPAPLLGGQTRQQARAVALDVARTFRPRHPMNPRTRAVYRVDDDSYVVIVEGATRTFHFRVSVAERIA